MRKGFVQLDDLKPYQALYLIGFGFVLFFAGVLITNQLWGGVEYYQYVIMGFAPLVATHRAVKIYIKEIQYKKVFEKQNGLCSRCHKPFDYSKNWDANYSEMHHKECP